MEARPDERLASPAVDRWSNPDLRCRHTVEEAMMADSVAQDLKRRWEGWKRLSKADRYVAVMMAWLHD
jgi:hypothetical protein